MYFQRESAHFALNKFRHPNEGNLIGKFKQENTFVKKFI